MNILKIAKKLENLGSGFTLKIKENEMRDIVISLLEEIRHTVSKLFLYITTKQKQNYIEEHFFYLALLNDLFLSLDLDSWRMLKFSAHVGYDPPTYEYHKKRINSLKVQYKLVKAIQKRVKSINITETFEKPLIIVGNDEKSARIIEILKQLRDPTLSFMILNISLPNIRNLFPGQKPPFLVYGEHIINLSSMTHPYILETTIKSIKFIDKHPDMGSSYTTEYIDSKQVENLIKNVPDYIEMTADELIEFYSQVDIILDNILSEFKNVFYTYPIFTFAIMPLRDILESWIRRLATTATEKLIINSWEELKYFLIRLYYVLGIQDVFEKTHDLFTPQYNLLILTDINCPFCKQLLEDKKTEIFFQNFRDTSVIIKKIEYTVEFDKGWMCKNVGIVQAYPAISFGTRTIIGANNIEEIIDALGPELKLLQKEKDYLKRQPSRLSIPGIHQLKQQTMDLDTIYRIIEREASKGKNLDQIVFDLLSRGYDNNLVRIAVKKYRKMHEE